MMNLSDFEVLNEHLKDVRPIFDSFCARNGFVYVDRKSLGRYPRIRIERQGPVNTWFELWMELDKDGNRFEHFREDLPYELGAGASFVEDNGTKYGVRYQKCFTCFSGKPFNRVGEVLESEMEKHLRTLEGWNALHLKHYGEKVQLGN